jgi:hypothetical protein
MNSVPYSIADWTDDPIQVDRQFTQICEMRDYYHLSYCSADRSSSVQPSHSFSGIQFGTSGRPANHSNR